MIQESNIYTCCENLYLAVLVCLFRNTDTAGVGNLYAL